MAFLITQDSLREACNPRPDYSTIVEQTRKALATYAEGEALRAIIKQWPKEEPDKFEWRREQMLQSYDNYVKEIAECYVEGVYRAKQPTRTGQNEKLNSYLNSDFNDWLEDEFAPFALFMPELWAICVVPEAKGDVISVQDQNDLQGLPYPVTVFPHYVANFGFNGDGCIEWVCMYLTTPPDVVKKDMSAEDKKKMIFELYSDTHYCRFNGDGEIQGEIVEHKYGCLPVARAVYRPNVSLRDSRRVGLAFMQSIVEISIGGMSAKGVLADYMYYSLYPKLVAGVGTIEGMIEAGVGANKPIAVSPNEKEIVPSYLQVPIQEFEALERIAYERIPSHAYRSARLRDRSGDKATAQSGISKAFDMVPEIGVLKKAAKFLKKADVQICGILDKLANGSGEVAVEYSSAFDVKSPAEYYAEVIDLGSAISGSALPTSETGNKLLAKRAYLALLPDATEAEAKKIEEEINAALTAPAVAAEVEPKKQTIPEEGKALGE